MIAQAYADPEECVTSYGYINWSLAQRDDDPIPALAPVLIYTLVHPRTPAMERLTAARRLDRLLGAPPEADGRLSLGLRSWIYEP